MIFQFSSLLLISLLILSNQKEFIDFFEYESNSNIHFFDINKFNNTFLFKIHKSKILNLDTYHIIRLHYLDALSFNFNISFLCENRKIVSKEDSFFPVNLLKDCLINEYFEFELIPKEISNKINEELIEYKEIFFIFEIVNSKFNTDNKLIHILFDKELLSFKSIFTLIIFFYIVKYIFIVQLNFNKDDSLFKENIGNSEKKEDLNHSHGNSCNHSHSQ